MLFNENMHYHSNWKICDITKMIINDYDWAHVNVILYSTIKNWVMYKNNKMSHNNIKYKWSKPLSHWC